MANYNSNNCSGIYAHLLLIFKELSSRIKARIKESQTTKSLNRQLITMTDVNEILSDFENMLNNSLSVIDTEVTISTRPSNSQTQIDNNQNINENRKMNKKQTITLNESQFNNLVTKIVKESVKRVLNEAKVNTPYGSVSTNPLKPSFDDRDTQTSLKNDTIEMLSSLPNERFMKYWDKRMQFDDPDIIDAIYQEYRNRVQKGQL